MSIKFGDNLLVDDVAVQLHADRDAVLGTVRLEFRRGIFTFEEHAAVGLDLSPTEARELAQRLSAVADDAEDDKIMAEVR